MNDWSYYAKKAQSLSKINKNCDAYKAIEEGLSLHPNQENLLSIASEICRKKGDFKGCIKFGNLLIKYHPSKAWGYQQAARGFVSLGMLREAKKVTAQGEIKVQEKEQMWIQNQWIQSFNKDTTLENKLLAHTFEPIQYWSQGLPPYEVRRLTDQWNSELDKIGITPISTYDKKSFRVDKRISTNTPFGLRNCFSLRIRSR